MHLYINGRFLTQEATGVQQFAKEICIELIETKTFKVIILVPKNQPVLDKRFNENIIRTGILKGHLWEQISLPLFLLKSKNALLINFCNTCPLLVKNQIYTIHDLAFKINPSWYNTWFAFFYNLLIPFFLWRCKFVITVSNTVKKEIINTYKIKKSKIKVLYNKVSTELMQLEAKKPSENSLISGSYYLMVGTQNPRKNFNFVVNYFKTKPDPKLVIVGGKSNNFISEEDNLNINNVVYLRATNNSELKWLYQNCIALINPSFYEGFGIPNIEAMIFNTGLLCSEIPVFKEICQDVAVYFDPNNLESLDLAIKQFEANKENQIGNKLKGLLLVKKYQEANRAQTIIKLVK